jgi:hypothetical protein
MCQNEALTLATAAIPILDGGIDGLSVILFTSTSGAVRFDVAEELVVAADDGLLGASQSARMASKLQARNVPCRSQTAPEATTHYQPV